MRGAHRLWTAGGRLSDSDAVSHSDQHRHAEPHADSYIDTHADEHAHAYGDAYLDAHADIHPSTSSRGDAEPAGSSWVRHLHNGCT